VQVSECLALALKGALGLIPVTAFYVGPAELTIIHTPALSEMTVASPILIRPA
jgi:hypothetical protein